MTKEEAKSIIVYYANIPDMIKYEKEEKDYLEMAYYDGVKSPVVSGMPHGGGSGKPTEKMGIRAAEHDARSRNDKHLVAINVLESDRDTIDAALSSMNGKYKRILLWKYVKGYSWVKIACEINSPCSTVRHWHDAAIEKFGEILEDDCMMINELVSRANRAY